MKHLPDFKFSDDEKEMLVQGWVQSPKDFTCSFPIPPRFSKYLDQNNLSPTEKSGLLFSGVGNVDFHVDHVPSRKS